MEGMIEFLNWLMKASGPIAALVLLLSYMFREKWRQLLAKSLGEDLEKLKHSHQRELEAYKVSLIVDAEKSRTESELRKAIALRYAEIEFESLIELDRFITHKPAFIIGHAMTAYSADKNLLEASDKCRDAVIDLSGSIDKCSVFLDAETSDKCCDLRIKLAEIMDDRLRKKILITEASATRASTLKLASTIQKEVRRKIQELGKASHSTK